MFESWAEPVRRAVGRAVVATPDRAVALTDLVEALNAATPSTIHLPASTSSWDTSALEAFDLAETLAKEADSDLVRVVHYLAALCDVAVRFRSGLSREQRRMLVGRLERLSGPSSDPALVDAVVQLSEAFNAGPSDVFRRPSTER